MVWVVVVVVFLVDDGVEEEARTDVLVPLPWLGRPARRSVPRDDDDDVEWRAVVVSRLLLSLVVVDRCPPPPPPPLRTGIVVVAVALADVASLRALFPPPFRAELPPRPLLRW